MKPCQCRSTSRDWITAIRPPTTTSAVSGGGADVPGHRIEHPSELAEDLAASHESRRTRLGRLDYAEARKLRLLVAELEQCVQADADARRPCLLARDRRQRPAFGLRDSSVDDLYEARAAALEQFVEGPA